MHKIPNTHETIKTILASRQPQLELAIQQLAQAAGNPVPQRSDETDFFHDFIDGAWDPYDEATRPNSKELKVDTKAASPLASQIVQLLGDERRNLLEKYDEQVSKRLSSELEQAFLVGYQCAIRFLLIGILPVSELMAVPQKDSSNGEELSGSEA